MVALSQPTGYLRGKLGSPWVTTNVNLVASSDLWGPAYAGLFFHAKILS